MPAGQKELFFVNPYIQATRNLLSNDFDKSTFLKALVQALILCEIIFKP
jgi:hypothetical protein